MDAPKKFSSSAVSAFTLVELIVVMTILAVLATVGFLALSDYSKDASASAVRTNLKILAQAVSSESVKNGDSPRNYVIHSGALVLSGATFSGTPLIPGAYGTAWTNYSAGTPDFGMLRTDPSKFKNPDGTPFFIAALDWLETLPSGKPRVRSFFQVAGTSGSGNMALEGTYPSSVAGSSAGLIASSSGSSTALADTSSSSSSGGGGGTSRYAGCDVDDIVLANGQVWAACNVGATTAFNAQAYPAATAQRTAGEKAYLGAIYQWGRNDDVTEAWTPTTTRAATGTLAGGVGHSNFIWNTPFPYDWIFASDDNLWGGSTTNLTSGTFADISSGNQAVMKGPCANGYHIPTQLEWCNAIISISPTRSGGAAVTCTSTWQTEAVTSAVRNTLKLPLAGWRRYSTAGYADQGALAGYWTSSPGYIALLLSTQINPTNATSRANGYSVRCLKD